MTATSKDGQTATATISYTVKHPIPRVRSLRLSRRRFYAATHRPTIAALETGTTITYTDTLAARTTFRVLRCAARGRTPCSRLILVERAFSGRKSATAAAITITVAAGAAFLMYRRRTTCDCESESCQVPAHVIDS